MTVPDFAGLDPGLAQAERLLADESTLATVLAALPNETAAATALNAMLRRSGATPRLRRRDDGWSVVSLGHTRDSHELARAATALAGLVGADGWRRVKRCAAAGCPNPFVDRTNAVTRRFCREHLRHRDTASARSRP